MVGDVKWDYEAIISFIRSILPNEKRISRNVLERALTIDNVNKVLTLSKLIDGAAAAIENSKSAKYSISTTGLLNILHDNRPSLIIILAESDSYIRTFFYDLGNRVYYLRKNKIVKNFPPTLFFLDEADLFIPSEPIPKEEKENIKQSIGMAMTISRRGRKYNLGLGISTQRTRYLNTSIMAQLATYFISKLPRKTDRAVISEGFGVEESFVDQVLSFNRGDWLVMSHAGVFGVASGAIPVKVENTEETVFKNCINIVESIRRMFSLYDKTAQHIFKPKTDINIFEEIDELECQRLKPFYWKEEKINDGMDELEETEEIFKEEALKQVHTFKTAKAMMEYLISQSKYTKREIIEQILEAFPNIKKSTLMTYISDSRVGSKYPSKFKKRIVIQEDGILFFES